MPILFHGSGTNNIQSFRPFSHFGTLDQALSAIVKKQEDWAAGNRKLTGEVEPVPTVYEVEIDPAALAKPLVIEDVGTPRSIGIAMGARDAFKHGSRLACTERHDAFEVIRESLFNEKSGWRGLSNEEKVIAEITLDARGFRQLAAELRKQGWTCLEYINVVEGMSPHTSICIPDPRHVLRFTQRPASAAELAGAKRQTRPINKT